jgi:hypothetical protein
MPESAFLMHVLGGAIGYAAAQQRGYSPLAGVVSGATMGPIFAWVLFLVSGILHANERRPCPHCREWTDPKATVCHHCGRGIAPVTTGPGGLRLVHSRRE